MSESSLSTRQRSVDSDTSLAPDPKRKKSLDTQRAFRARKAAHVKDLEVKVALQELEIARLKRENGVLQADLAKLRNSAHISNATRFPDNPSIVVHEHKRTHPSVFQPMPSVMRDMFSEIPTPSISRPAHVAVLAPGAQNLSQSAYSTSSLPVVSPANQPRAIAASPGQPTPSQSSTSSSVTQTPSPRPSPLSTTSSDANTNSPSVTPISAPPTVALARVVCCNNMFTCDEGDNESEARWLKQNTGVQGIGSNTMDDFYALFGGESAVTSTAGNT